MCAPSDARWAGVPNTPSPKATQRNDAAIEAWMEQPGAGDHNNADATSRFGDELALYLLPPGRPYLGDAIIFLHSVV
jgi:hypothetical protein